MSATRDRVTEAPAKKPTTMERIVPGIGKYGSGPLLMLFGLNLVDEFDIFAFGVLTPNIKDAFGLSNAGVGGLRALAALAGLAIPFVGFAGDRWKRIPITWSGAMIWGVMAFSTGLAPTVAVMAFVRFGSGAAKIVNESVHPSLLADYYPPESRGRVFGVHRSANAFGAILAPATAGGIAALMGWRWSFMLMALPTFVLAMLAMRLREPIRGESEDLEAAMEAAKEEPVPFGRAMRWLFSVPTLKRIYVGAFCAGLGGIAYATFSAEYLEELYGLQEFSRGMIQSAGGVTGLAGFVLGGRIADQWQREKTLGHLAVFYGASIVAVGVSLILYAVAPFLGLVIVMAIVAGFFLGLWVAPYLTIIGYASPARIRSMGYSMAGFFFTLGIIGLVPVGAVGDAHGIRWSLVTAAVVLTISGLVLGSAARFVNGDVERAMKVLQTEATLRQERLAAGDRSLLVIRDLDVSYGQTQVLFGVDLEVKEGELVALLGTNGAGKSTLLKAISGLVHPTSGAVFFDGRDITHFEPEETAETGIIQMPGGKAVFPTLSVQENLELAQWMYNKDPAHVAKARKRALEIFPVLAERMNQQAGSLSGGEQQMLSLAQAFIARPRILMIDELSLGLAPLIVQQLLKVVEEIHGQGVTIILVEQSVNVALTVARHAYFMEKGEIRFDGPTDELLGREDILRSVFLEGAESVVGNGDGRGEPASRRSPGTRSR